MNTEIKIAVFKVVTAVISGVLGAVGLYNFRDASGHRTRMSNWLLVGIALSASVGVGTPIFEAQKDLASSREQAARTETVLRELSRSIKPIRELKLSY
jgi:hypothetical protein